MANPDAERKGRLRRVLRALGKAVLVPDPEPIPEPGELYVQRRSLHDELSKTIRRVFYALVGTCLFCVVTLAGTPDAKMLTPDATVKLPVLNYDMGFEAFLVVGPVLLIALTIYLQIFVGHHRRYPIPEQDRLPMLPNFGSVTAKSVMVLIFYWMVPVTLAVFAWKAQPRPVGPYLSALALGVTAILVILQARRSPRGQPAKARAVVALFTVFFLFIGGIYSIPGWRQLELFKADLSGKDLRGMNLSYAFMQEAILIEANLTDADLFRVDLTVANLFAAKLTRANLTSADLSEAKLTDADLSGANLSGAKLSGADLTYADLSGAVLIKTDLIGARLPEANLSEAGLSGADLSKADLSDAILSKADMTGVDLSEADLSGADLSGADLSEANLSGAKLIRADLTEANLFGANLSEADLRGADLTGANLILADLSGAYLRAAVFWPLPLEGEKLETAKKEACARLTAARHWREAYRDPEMACGATIPGLPSEKGQ